MLKKKINIVFITLFFLIILIPLAFTNYTKGKISVYENRVLAPFPALFVDHKWNKNVLSDLDKWINDNVGFRSDFIAANAKVQYELFNKLQKNGDYILGPNGEFDFAPSYIIKDILRENMKSENTLKRMAKGFQVAKDFLAKKNIQMIYFQCTDKHTIYPEYYPDRLINQSKGKVSKTDTIIESLKKYTDIDFIYPKNELIEAKNNYDTYSKFGDSTHWTQRGAFIGYQLLMDKVNALNSNNYKVLKESDYNITLKDMGLTLFGGIHRICMLENFDIKNPQAKITNDKLTLFAEDKSNSFRTNESVNNKTRVLILGDSYFNSFIVDDIAESFYETILIWGDYSQHFKTIIETYKPNIVIIENAERCDRTDALANAALAM